MLVLARYVGERLILTAGTDTIIIEVTSTGYEKARLGITAPRSVDIQREEIYVQQNTDTQLPPAKSELSLQAKGHAHEDPSTV